MLFGPSRHSQFTLDVEATQNPGLNFKPDSTDGQVWREMEER